MTLLRPTGTQWGQREPRVRESWNFSHPDLPIPHADRLDGRKNNRFDHSASTGDRFYGQDEEPLCTESAGMGTKPLAV